MKRTIAGLFVGVGSIILIGVGAYRGDFPMIALGMTPLSSMLAFFVGESNGQKQALQEIQEEG